MTPRTPLTCIDLFCGCGGFSLGMIRAGFQVVAAIDFNRKAAWPSGGPDGIITIKSIGVRP